MPQCALSNLHPGEVRVDLRDRSSITGMGVLLISKGEGARKSVSRAKGEHNKIRSPAVQKLTGFSAFWEAHGYIITCFPGLPGRKTCKFLYERDFFILFHHFEKNIYNVNDFPYMYVVLPWIMLKSAFPHLKPAKSPWSIWESQRAQFLDMFKKDNYQNWSIWRWYINILSSGILYCSELKTRFLPGTSLILPAGDVGGEIKGFGVVLTQRTDVLAMPNGGGGDARIFHTIKGGGERTGFGPAIYPCCSPPSVNQWPVPI